MTKKQVDIRVPFTLVGAIDAEITVRISPRGVALVLPIKFKLEEGEIPAGPINLSGFEATLDEAFIKGGCDATLAKKEIKHLLKMHGTITIPLKRPNVVATQGDLVFMSVLPAGNVSSKFDFDRARFDSDMLLGVRRIFELDGHVGLNFKEFDFKGTGSLKAFGASLAHADMTLNKDRFAADAKLELLLVRSEAKVVGSWSPLSDSNVNAGVTFGFYAFGKHITVAGAKAAASLRPSAELTAIVLGSDIKLLDIDFAGITIELLLSQPLCLTGLKLFAGQGGGGAKDVLISEDGTMFLLTQSQEKRVAPRMVLYEHDGIVCCLDLHDGADGMRIVRLIEPGSDPLETTWRPASPSELRPPNWPRRDKKVVATPGSVPALPIFDPSR